MKNQINILNIAGAVVSTSLIVFLYFLPSFDIFSFAKRRGISKTQEIKSLQEPSLSRNEELVNSTSVDTDIPSNINQEEEIPEQITTVEIQKQEEQPKKLAEKCEEPSKSFGCPKNLDYFTTRPRPKQTPEECITCSNLITCVCQTDN